MYWQLWCNQTAALPDDWLRHTRAGAHKRTRARTLNGLCGHRGLKWRKHREKRLFVKFRSMEDDLPCLPYVVSTALSAGFIHTHWYNTHTHRQRALSKQLILTLCSSVSQHASARNTALISLFFFVNLISSFFYVVLLRRFVWRCCVALPKIAVVMERILMWAAYLLIY